jgi:repressor of nif and glnA expression
MIAQHTSDVERKIIAILKLLSDSPQPLGGRILARRLGDLGIDLGERAVRYHLRLMDQRGLTHLASHSDGRSITKLGTEELNNALVTDRLGLVTAEIEKLTYQSSFDYEKHAGDVPINVSLFSSEDFNQAVKAMKDAFQTGLGISDLVATASGGEELGGVVVPPGMTGLATMSHIVVYGALLKTGTPVYPRFGGILQTQDYEALRFVDIIEYSGCSLDPSEVFISSKMTSVGKVAKEGKGKILASFCEIPSVARLKVEALIKELGSAGVNGLVILGGAGETLCQLPVGPGRMGMILADGLNPVAAAVEAGIEATNHHMGGVIDFALLGHFDDYCSGGE